MLSSTLLSGVVEMERHTGLTAALWMSMMFMETVHAFLSSFPDIGLVASFTNKSIHKIVVFTCEHIPNFGSIFGKTD